MDLQRERLHQRGSFTEAGVLDDCRAPAPTVSEAGEFAEASPEGLKV